MGKITNFDYSEDEQILKRLMSEVAAFCYSHKIPLFIATSLKSNEDKTEYITKFIEPTSMGVHLKDNYYPEFANVLNGFKTHIDDEIKIDSKYFEE